MNTTCLIYLTIDIEKYQEYLRIKESISDFIDTYFFLDNKSFDHTNLDKDDIIIFNGYSIWDKYNDLQNYRGLFVGNSQFLIAEISKYKEYSQYKYFYFIEDDIKMPNGNIEMFFKSCETIECDLLLCSDEFQDNSKSWYWYDMIDNKFAYKYPVHHYIQLFRLSKSGCDLIRNKFDKSYNAHCECAIPSIIYRNGLTTKFICNELSEYNFILDYEIRPEWTDEEFVFNENTWYHPLK